MALQLSRHRFTVAEYYQMAEVGIFDEDDRVELIDGEIVDMAPIGGEHIGCVTRLTGLFARGLADALVQVQSPIRLDERNEPQPDLVLLRPETSVYPARPEDVLLVVEVADTSFRYDRQVKVPAYARAGTPEVWLVHLSRRAVVVHRDPYPEGYHTITTLRAGETVAPQAFPTFTLTVEQILG